MNGVKKEQNSKQSNKSNMEPELDRPGKLMVSGIPKRKDYRNDELEKVFSAFGRVAEGEVYKFANF